MSTATTSPGLSNSPGLTMLTEQMKSEGYTPALADPVDREVCMESDCAECKHKGLACLGFRRRGAKEHSYRVFAACPECGDWGEF